MNFSSRDATDEKVKTALGQRRVARARLDYLAPVHRVRIARAEPSLRSERAASAAPPLVIRRGRPSGGNTTSSRLAGQGQ